MANPFRDIRPPGYQKVAERYRKVIPPDLRQSAENLAAKPIPPRRPLSTGLETYTGTFGEDEAAHLLKRTLFGLKKSELRTFAAMSMADAVEAILQSSPIPTPPVNNYRGYNDRDDPDVPVGDSWIQAPYDVELEGGRVISLKGWLLKNMTKQAPTLHEKMILFWHNLLAIQTWDVFVGKADYQYFEMLRRNAFGNYKTMVRDLTLDPAMLLFLNGTFNNKEQPDENYARELQELFTVGKGAGSQYTEADVSAAARVLTGWVINWEEAEGPGDVSSFFYPNYHDTTDKQFSAFYGNRVIAGQSGLGGAQELDELLEMIFDTQEAAKYICRRLYNFFVYPEIDATTETNVIEPLAEQFRSGGYEILPVLRTLFKSAHFFDVANRGAMIKSPIDTLVGLWRTLGFASPQPDDLSVDLNFYVSALWNIGGQGQELGDPPSVAGWPAYYQAPQYDKSWMTTDTITKRALITDSLVWWGFWINENLQLPADLIGYLETLDAPEDPNAVLMESAQLMLGIALDEASRNELKTILLSGQSSDYYWTDAWTAYQADPSDSNRTVVENRLKPTLQALMQLGEFQLM